MTDMLTVAACICRRHEEEYGQKIDEMKLHKMLYFAQREALIQTDEPLFEDQFQGWRYGPVMKDLRGPFQKETLPQAQDADMSALKPILDAVFREFGQMDAFSLSRLTHGEISWKASRRGIAPTANGSTPMATDDIRRDAQRILERQRKFREHGLL